MRGPVHLFFHRSLLHQNVDGLNYAPCGRNAEEWGLWCAYMSTGTRRKVFLAAAALGEPAAVIADGPSNGLDAPARAVLAEQFKAWARDRVVLFASHDDELVQACGARVMRIAELR